MALARVFKALYTGGGDQSERNLLTDRKSNLLVAEGAAPYAELVRQGNVWSAMNTAALASLIVRPSTVANFTLFNNEPAGGLSYVILRAFAHNMVSTAVDTRAGLWLCAHPTGLVSPTNDITARGSHLAKSAYGGNSVCDTAMTVTDDGWFPWGESTQLPVTGALLGGQLVAHVNGSIIVPPQCGISTQVVTGSTAQTFISGFTWAEVQLDYA